MGSAPEDPHGNALPGMFMTPRFPLSQAQDDGSYRRKEA